MPHFYFELVEPSGAALTDDQGADFPDLNAAIVDAQQGFAELLAESILQGEAMDVVGIDIRDEQHKLLTTLRFDERGKRLGAA